MNLSKCCPPWTEIEVYAENITDVRKQRVHHYQIHVQSFEWTWRITRTTLTHLNPILSCVYSMANETRLPRPSDSVGAVVKEIDELLTGLAEDDDDDDDDDKKADKKYISLTPMHTGVFADWPVPNMDSEVAQSCSGIMASQLCLRQVFQKIADLRRRFWGRGCSLDSYIQMLATFHHVLKSAQTLLCPLERLVDPAESNPLARRLDFIMRGMTNDHEAAVSNVLQDAYTDFLRQFLL
jgi:hypothetical protein